jgi:carbon monoxide dehydrogenase subunit G
VTVITVSTIVPAGPAAVWEELRHVDRHVEWMADAEAIRFRSGQTEGVGTTFETDTKVGPIRLKDVMEITEWDAGQVMGIRHTGVVTGTGRFTLESVGDGTRLTWEENLEFPFWMGGSIGGRVGRVVLARIWQRNLANLSRRLG